MASKSNNLIKDTDLERWLVAVKQRKQIITDFTQIAPKLQYALQKQHKYMNQLSTQLISTYISAANADNPFSNPEDSFASQLIEMGYEMQKFELSEKDHLQTITKHLVDAMQQFKRNQYKKITPLKKKYRNLKKKHKKTKDKNVLMEVNNTKNKLIAELYALQSRQNTDLLNDVDSYWRSYSNLISTKNNIMQDSINRLKKEDDKKDDDDEEDNKFAVDFDMKEIDKKVGFNDIQIKVLKFLIKRIHIKTLTKYNRVIYIDSTIDNNKIIKFLSLKNHLKQYMLKDIEKVEKVYNDSMSEIKLKFKDKKEYHYQFESAVKREEFVGQLLEYHTYKTKNNLMSILVGSWNVGDSAFNIDAVRRWFPSATEQYNDLYIIGLQEVDYKSKNKWISGILSHIDTKNEYIVLIKTWLMGIGILVIIHINHIAKISHLQSSTVATGKGNIIGNKGGTAISFQFMESTFLFVNCHLAARAERFTKRAKNFTRIVKELNLGIIKNVDILHQFTHVVWFGDLNYRIEKEFGDVLQLVDEEKWSDLVKFDQLYHQMRFDTVFSGFCEGQISFCPTYRWERSKNIVSNKRNQPPSYTDRILYRTLPNTFDLWQETYSSSPNCFGSDHRPIVSILKFKPRIPYFSTSFRRKYSQITISFVDLKAKIADINIKNNIEITFHCLHSSPMTYKLNKGEYDDKTHCWRWPIMELDSLKIVPFICDPAFLSSTHLFVSLFQKNHILCHGVISLFNAFPTSLIDTEKMKQEYKKANKQMQTVQEAMDMGNDVKKQEEVRNHKGFNIKLSKEGGNIGSLEGFINIDGELIRKHMRFSTIDAHKKAISPKVEKRSVFNTSFWNKKKRKSSK